MKENRIPYIPLHGSVHGTRSIGRPRRIDGIRIGDDCDGMGVPLLQALILLLTEKLVWKEMVDELPRHTCVLQRPQVQKVSSSYLIYILCLSHCMFL